jgi:uncharacterized protein (TIGR03790 family)
MLLPSADEVLARAVIDRGIKADGSAPSGTVYLVRTQDAARNVRASGFADAEALLSNRVRIVEIATPVQAPLVNIMGYFTGDSRVEELSKLSFRPGAAADHLTSTGGQLDAARQMSALAWLRQGATAFYGRSPSPATSPESFPILPCFSTIIYAAIRCSRRIGRAWRCRARDYSSESRCRDRTALHAEAGGELSMP